MHAVDLEIVDRWLDAGEETVRTELARGGSMERLALLTGSKKILDSLKQDIRGPRFAAAHPVVRQKAVSLGFLAALENEKLPEHLSRVKAEAAQRGLSEVVGFVRSLEERQQRGEFEVAAPKRTKVFAVPNRTPDNDLASALNSIASAKAREKYRAIVEALALGAVNDDELRSRLRERGHGMVPGTVTAYRGDLARAGWVRYTGEHRAGESGSSMKVWEIAP